MNMAIKLLGVCRVAEDGSISVRTAPFLVRENHPLHSVQDVFNGVFVHGNMVDDLMFYGRGAGKFPTASAVVSDVIECAKNIGRTVEFVWDNEIVPLSDPMNESYRYFVRVSSAEAAKAGEIFGRLSEIRFEGMPEDEFAFVTPKMTEGEIRKTLNCFVSASKEQRIRLLED